MEHIRPIKARITVEGADAANRIAGALRSRGARARIETLRRQNAYRIDTCADTDGVREVILDACPELLRGAILESIS